MTKDDAVRLADDRATVELVPVRVYEAPKGFLVTTLDLAPVDECVYTAWPRRVAA